MSKARKVVMYLTAVLGGSALIGCGGWGGFYEGLLHKGFVDNWWMDVVTDWLNEDLFG